MSGTKKNICGLCLDGGNPPDFPDQGEVNIGYYISTLLTWIRTTDAQLLGGVRNQDVSCTVRGRGYSGTQREYLFV
jgi:hypothetical protein